MNDLPDRFLSGESSDEDEDERDWIGEFDGRDADFDMRDNVDPVSANGHEFRFTHSFITV